MKAIPVVILCATGNRGDAEDPEQAYGGLVNHLVGQVTRDFRVTWATRPAPSGP